MNHLRRLLILTSAVTLSIGFVANAGAASAGNKLTKLEKSYANAQSQYSKGVAGKKRVDAGYSAWLAVYNDYYSFNKKYCSGKKVDPNCAKAKGIMDKAAKDLAGFYKGCMKHPKYDWWDVVSSLVKIQNRAPYKAALKDLNAWMIKLGADKTAYWKGEIKKYKSWKKYAKAQSALCYAANDKGMKNWRYAFSLSEKKMYIRCTLAQPRSKYSGKSKNDFFRVKVEPGAYVSHNEVKAKVKWKGSVGTFQFPLKSVRAKLAASPEHVGDWAYLSIDLYRTWNTGKGWVNQNGKRVWTNIWNNDKLGYGTILVQLR